VISDSAARMLSGLFQHGDPEPSNRAYSVDPRDCRRAGCAGTETAYEALVT
jgi:hypothetical protein